MGTGACQAHVAELLRWGPWPLVPELDGTVVGEMEGIAGPDVNWGRTPPIGVLFGAKDQRPGASDGPLWRRACAARASLVGCQNLLTTIDLHGLPGLARPDLTVGKAPLIPGGSLRGTG